MPYGQGFDPNTKGVELDSRDVDRFNRSHALGQVGLSLKTSNSQSDHMKVIDRFELISLDSKDRHPV